MNISQHFFHSPLLRNSFFKKCVFSLQKSHQSLLPGRCDTSQMLREKVSTLRSQNSRDSKTRRQWTRGSHGALHFARVADIADLAIALPIIGKSLIPIARTKSKRHSNIRFRDGQFLADTSSCLQ